MLKRTRAYGVWLLLVSTLILMGCGGGTTGTNRAHFTLTGEFAGALQTDRATSCPLTISASVVYLEYALVGTVGGHVIRLSFFVSSQRSIEGDNPVAIPSWLPVATADPSGGRPGDFQSRGRDLGNTAVLLDELTTERHYLRGTVRVKGGNSGSVTLSDSRLNITGDWTCP